MDLGTVSDLLKRVKYDHLDNLQIPKTTNQLEHLLAIHDILANLIAMFDEADVVMLGSSTMIDNNTMEQTHGVYMFDHIKHEHAKQFAHAIMDRITTLTSVGSYDTMFTSTVGVVVPKENKD